MEHKSQNVICQNCKCDFIIEPEDFKFYEKIKVPPPTFCPECRLVRRLRIRNERALFKANCNLCGKNTVTMYNPQTKFVIYCNSCYLGGKWNPLDYGKEYNFSKSFFVQFAELAKIVPRKAVHSIGGGINTEYSNYLVNTRESYLSYSVVGSERIYYSRVVDDSKECVDCSNIKECESCYENIFGTKNYGSIYLVSSRNCIDSKFLFDCTNCQNCFLSSNLRNKSYTFKNVQYSKTEYEAKILEINLGNFLVFNELVSNFFEMIEKNSIHKYIHKINAINSSGNNILNSKNINYSFNVNGSENSKYAIRMSNSKDCMDIFGIIQTELAYESIAPSFQGSDAQFCAMNRACSNIKYSSYCNNSSYLFACIGLKNKQYCILNKQYTKEEYEELVPKIIQHMNDMPYIDSKGRIYRYGEFFPSELSPFAYNETIAQEYFPLTKKEALEQGYKWKDKEERNYTIDIRTEDIPNDIKDVDDSILNKVIECEHKDCNHQCTEAFKIIPNELQFYKRMNLPIPHLCPNCRHYNRLSQRNPLKLWHRKCMKENCTNEFETSYSPDRPEIVYCEKCYNGEVY